MLDSIYQKEIDRIKLLAQDGDYGDFEHPVIGSGSIVSGIMLIGEAPGADEAKQGRPFVGKAGKQLDELLSLCKMPRDDIFITNVVKYRPVNRKITSISNRTPRIDEILGGIPCLKSEIEALNPRIIVTLGNTPISAVCITAGEPKIRIGDVHGSAREVKIDGVKRTLFALYHPASVIYNRTLKQVLEEDMVALGNIAVENRPKEENI